MLQVGATGINQPTNLEIKEIVHAAELLDHVLFTNLLKLCCLLTLPLESTFTVDILSLLASFFVFVQTKELYVFAVI
jgi:hypothetical protein